MVVIFSGVEGPIGSFDSKAWRENVNVASTLDPLVQKTYEWETLVFGQFCSTIVWKGTITSKVWKNQGTHESFNVYVDVYNFKTLWKKNNKTQLPNVPCPLWRLRKVVPVSSHDLDWIWRSFQCVNFGSLALAFGNSLGWNFIWARHLLLANLWSTCPTWQFCLASTAVKSCPGAILPVHQTTTARLIQKCFRASLEMLKPSQHEYFFPDGKNLGMCRAFHLRTTFMLDKQFWHLDVWWHFVMHFGAHQVEMSVRYFWAQSCKYLVPFKWLVEAHVILRCFTLADETASFPCFTMRFCWKLWHCV